MGGRLGVKVEMGTGGEVAWGKGGNGDWVEIAFKLVS